MTVGSDHNNDRDAQAEVAHLESALKAQAAEAAAEHGRLTYELGHRVKNTLSMVQALANQTFRGAASPEEALDVFSQRIMALAHANDAILKESWTTATIEAVAAAVLLPHGHPPGALTIAGPEQRIGAGAALSFALALHELATNAKRFGAWKDKGGQISLRWEVRDGANAPAALHLSWIESGGPPAEEPARRGFGLRFAERSLRSAFGRDVAFEFRPTGFACHVTADLATLAA